MQLGREWFKVIGVMEPRGEVFGQNLDLFMLMPYQTALAFTGEQVRPDFHITFVVDDPDAGRKREAARDRADPPRAWPEEGRPERLPGAGVGFDRQDLLRRSPA